MKNLTSLQARLRDTDLEDWAESLPKTIDQVLATYTHGEISGWLKMIDSLPEISVTDRELEKCVSVNSDDEISPDTLKQIAENLMQLHPWRKGPFSIHGIDLNTEWRSDWKWERIAPHLGDLSYKNILDVGCGNGYHLFRIIGAGANSAIGIDPSQKFHAQFLAMNHFIQCDKTFHLPIGIEHMTNEASKGFDMVFSMGVLYHRRSPIEHIQQLKTLVCKGGHIVLETLVVDGDVNTVLIPEGRYAQMRNVWFLPSTDALERWLYRCDLKDVKLIDVNQTSLDEQRATDWMTFHSLKNYLDPNDINKTVEGYPAPKRATFIARVAD